MALSSTDQQLLENMKHRELTLKRRQRATNAIFQEMRRFRVGLVALDALVFAAVLTAICSAFGSLFENGPDLERQALVTFVVGAAFGALVGHGWLRTQAGQKVLAGREIKLNEKYSGDLHAGRRWQQFYYRGEDISAYVPQILYVIEGEQRFDSVDEALAFVKAHARESAAFRARARELFDSVAAQTNLVAITSADEEGRLSSRFMRFVKTEQPGVWLVTTAPDAPKVHEFDRGRVALITEPIESGATISSNRVRIRRSDRSFPQIADLYRAQAPRYLDGMTEADQEREVVYELTLESAKVDTWADHELVVFDSVDRLDSVD